MTDPDHTHLHRGRRRIRVVRVLLLIVLVPLALLTTAGIAATMIATQLDAYENVPAETLSEAIGAVALDIAGENPRFEPNPATGPTPICEDVPTSLVKALKLGLAYMRATPEGESLFQLLVDNEICIRIDDLPFNAAYASLERTRPDDWTETEIVVDRSLVRSGLADVLAAVLVHEATHVQRAIDGEACFLTDECTELPNGVPIEEEVAAHAAEAEWWIAAFGTDGKRFAVRADHGLNTLVDAYLGGSDAFRRFVIDIRDDPREGSGF